ncbi:MAG TPA: hypothetical protein VM686_32295 [Polyangiaceae bacterium]|nr:hypothetical protein [Polyangiaceae bacterium]
MNTTAPSEQSETDERELRDQDAWAQRQRAERLFWGDAEDQALEADEEPSE